MSELPDAITARSLANPYNTTAAAVWKACADGEVRLLWEEFTVDGIASMLPTGDLCLVSGPHLIYAAPELAVQVERVQP